MSTPTYQRETDEFQPVTVEVDGQPVTTGITFAVVPSGQRPVTFTAPMTLDGKIGVNVVGLTRGTYQVFARIVSAPETPVILCGSFYIA